MLELLLKRYPELSVCRETLEASRELLLECYRSGGKLLVCGNGGSCADSDHIVGELMKGFLLRRPIPEEFRDTLKSVAPDYEEQLVNSLQGALPAISLTAHGALLSAFANDMQPDMIYAQQIYGYGRPGDVFLGITTSGNSNNVVHAAVVAKALGMKVIALVGECSCRLDEWADVAIHVPRKETYQVQELHLPVYHYLCAACEAEMFSQ